MNDEMAGTPWGGLPEPGAGTINTDAAGTDGAGDMYRPGIVTD